MVAPLVAAAGIGALGSVIGGVTGGKGAKKAAQVAQQTARMQIAEARRREQFITGLEQPTITRGNEAGSLYGNFLGLEGGDKAAAVLGTFRGSTGYQDLLNTGLASVNSNAYARGMGASGATMKALQAKGMALADQSAGQWLGGLDRLVGYGRQAVGNITGVTQNTGQIINNANQNAGDAQGNAALIGSSAWQNALQNLANIGGAAAGGGGFGSSYAPLGQSAFNGASSLRLPAYAGFS